MGIQITWDNPERTLLRFTFEDYWTASDYHYAYDLSCLFRDSVNWTVDLLIDLTHSKVEPDQLLSVFGRYGNEIPADNQGIVVILGADLRVRNMLAFRRRISPQQMGELFFAETLDEAHILISAHYEGLVPA